MALTSKEVVRVLLKSDLNLTVYAREMTNESPTAAKVYTVRSIGYYGNPKYDTDFGIMLGLEELKSDDAERGKQPANKGDGDCHGNGEQKAETRRRGVKRIFNWMCTHRPPWWLAPALGIASITISLVTILSA